MLETEISFEIHLTIGNLLRDKEKEFIDFCQQNGGKPLIIELFKGDYTHQPMFTKVIYSNDFASVLENSKRLSIELMDNHFTPKRLKIEVPDVHGALFDLANTSFDKYYEWHGKVEYLQAEKLEALCKQHKAHLSLNSLKEESNTRFITLREFGNRQTFVNKVSKLTQTLSGEWTILKQQSEYCIYDDNIFLDKGWLP